MNVNTTNTYSTSSATNKGMSGMISGMDTESMVEQMLSGTQNKIDKQEQEKQKIIWQQLKYREIIANLNKFQNTFFGSTSATNLSSIDFFNSMSVNSSSNAFHIVASADAAMGNTSIRVGQLATASSIKSGSKVSGGLSGSRNIDLDAFNRDVIFNVGGSEKKVTLSAADPKKSDAENLKVLADELTEAGISASIDENGKLKMTGDFSISSKSSALGMEMLGVTAGQKSADGSLTTTAKPDAKVSFDIELNGIKRTISLDDSAKDTLAESLRKEINSTFGSGWIKVEEKDNKISINTQGKGNSLVVSGSQSGLDLLGLQSGQSDKISRTQMLKDTNFANANALQGDKFEFTINGEKFEFTGDNTINDVIKTVNARSKAGVRITYSDLEDKFTIESSETGAGREIAMSQQSGNLLNAMFGDVKGMNTPAGLSSKQLLSGSAKGVDTSGYGDSFEGGYFTFKVDGKSYSISIPSNGKTSRDQVFSLINEGLASRFGYNGDEQNIELKKNGNSYEMVVRNGAKVTFEDVEKDVTDADKLKEIREKNLHAAFGFNGSSNVVKATDDNFAGLTLKDVGLSDTDTTKLSDYINTLKSDNLEAKFEDGRIVVSVKKNDDGTPSANDVSLPDDAITKKLFGEKAITLNKIATTGTEITKGQNAIAEINGVTVERSTNTFEANGMTISLNEATEQLPVLTATGNANEWMDQFGSTYQLNTSDGSITVTDKSGNTLDTYKNMTGLGVKQDESGNYYIVDTTDNDSKVFTGKAETVTTSRNTDKIVDGLKSFVEKYNEMIDELNTLIHADATYRDYPPLTSAQKKEMSEREIELWEEKAQEGLFRNDSDISSFLQNMRTALYSKPAGSELALYDIGIESSSEWRDYGKLEFDESKVRSMVESNPQAVQELFTNATDGLAALMNKELDRTAKTSSGSAGTLVEKAGVQGKATAITNQMTQRLISINERIEELKKKYETEKTRYWNQFNSMETALANMSSQSSWLAMQFSY